MYNFCLSVQLLRKIKSDWGKLVGLKRITTLESSKSYKLSEGCKFSYLFMAGKHEAQKKTNISKELKVSASTFSYPFLWLSLGFLYNRSLLVYLRLSSSTLNKKIQYDAIQWQVRKQLGIRSLFRWHITYVILKDWSLFFKNQNLFIKGGIIT